MMKKKHWVLAVAVGITVGLIVAAAMTFLDWRQNPGGIFHGATGTHWNNVAETAASWFFPVAAVASGAVAAALFLLNAISTRRNVPRK